MKLIIKYLFQVPFLFFFILGVYSSVGCNLLIAALIGILALFLYTAGDYLE